MLQFYDRKPIPGAWAVQMTSDMIKSPIALPDEIKRFILDHPWFNKEIVNCLEYENDQLYFQDIAGGGVLPVYKNEWLMLQDEKDLLLQHFTDQEFNINFIQ